MKSLRKQKKRFSLKDHKRAHTDYGALLGLAIRDNIKKQMREPVGIMYCRDEGMVK